MIGALKPFSKSLHRNNDPKSRQVVKAYLKRNDIVVEDNPNRYGVDLISPDGTLQIEIEHRLVWTTDEFPFDDINVPERKAKFFVQDSVAYVILSKTYSHIGFIPGRAMMKYIVDENLRENRNKYVREGEYFYKVPKDAFKWDKV
jgi:hypothetical protein